MIGRKRFRRFSEAGSSTYKFLICDGNGAASRGGEVDNYYEKTIKATSLRSAIKKIWEYLVKDVLNDDEVGDFRKWLRNHELTSGFSIEEFLDAFQEDWNEDAGYPFIEGIACGGRVIWEPEYIQERVWEEEYFDEEYFKEQGINPKFWHIDLPDDEDEDF